MPAKNTPIGEVVCPHKGCERVCQVFGFRTRGVRKDGSPRPSVFTGKKYLVCPDHGRIGADGSAQVTEYILTKGTMWGARKPEPAAKNPESKGERGTAAAPKNPQPSPTRSASPNPKNPEQGKAATAKRSWWDPSW